MDISQVKKLVFAGTIIGGLCIFNIIDEFFENRKQINSAEQYLSSNVSTVLTWQEQSVHNFFPSGMSDNENQKFISEMKNDYGSCQMRQNPNCRIKTNHISCPYAQHLKHIIECKIPITCQKKQSGLLTVQLLKNSYKCVSFEIKAR